MQRRKRNGSAVIRQFEPIGLVQAMDAMDIMDRMDVNPQVSLFGVHVVHHFEKRLLS
jgi:hypothetical protein